MVKNFVRVGRWPCAPAVARDLIPLLNAHKAEMGFDLGVNSIYRTRSEQAAIFTSRYTRGAYSPYGDYRTYQGAAWGRTSGLGPVASPDVGSNHTRGYAVDFAISYGTASFNWLRSNAHRFNFNWIEGQSINEPWHWCWYVGIFPTRNTPDPWEGRGAPDPVYASDPGMTLDGGSAPGGGSTETATTQSEEDEVILVRVHDWKGRHYALGQEYIKQIKDVNSVKAEEDATGKQEIPVSRWTFQRMLAVRGIPSNVLDGSGRVLDDLNGQGEYVHGGSWSRAQKVERLAYLAQK